MTTMPEITILLCNILLGIFIAVCFLLVPWAILQLVKDIYDFIQSHYGMKKELEETKEKIRDLDKENRSLKEENKQLKREADLQEHRKELHFL